MKRINCFSFPRSGSNAFAAYMHVNTACYSINCGGGKLISVSPDQVDTVGIYPKGFSKKIPPQKCVILYDELKPFNLRLARYGIYVESRIHKSNDISAYLFRSPLSIARSMDNFAKKYNRRKWAVDSDAKCRSFLKRFAHFWRLSSHRANARTFVNLHRFFLDAQYRDQIENIWFANEIQRDHENPFLPKNLSCSCGGIYQTGRANVLKGTFFELNHIQQFRDDVLICNTCEAQLVGKGGFLPTQRPDYPRFSTQHEGLKSYILSLENKELTKLISKFNEIPENVSFHDLICMSRILLKEL